MTAKLIPPWIIPDLETYSRLEQGMVTHRPEFAPALVQKQLFADPRLKMSRKHTVRDYEMGVLSAILEDARGGFESVLTRVHRPRRGNFSTGELLANPYFANGTTNWSTASGGNLALSVIDRVMRGYRYAAAPDYKWLAASFTTVSGNAYVARAMVVKGKGAMDYRLQLGTSAGGAELAADSADNTPSQFRTIVGIATGTTTHFSILDGVDGRSVGDYMELEYASVARCLQVDGTVASGLSTIAVDKGDASTDGVLKKGDFFEINGEIKMCTAPVNTDVNGKATIRFSPALVRAAVDNDPVIIHYPFGKFQLSNYEEENKFGLQLAISYDLEHIYE